MIGIMSQTELSKIQVNGIIFMFAEIQLTLQQPIEYKFMLMEKELHLLLLNNNLHLIELGG